MGRDHVVPLEERYHVYPQQTIAVEDFPAVGSILDIGGGGEGVIGLLKGERVIAVDLRSSELEEAPSGPLKIVADARELPFLDDTFETATAFYSLMYLKTTDDISRAFSEAYRVLRPGGRFLIWDAAVERPIDTTKPAYVITLRIHVGVHEIETGYGQPWPEPPRSASLYRTLATSAGFEPTEVVQDGQHVFLQLTKPA